MLIKNRKSSILKQAGFTQVMVLLLLLIGVGASVFLVQRKTNFLPKADNANSPPVLVDAKFYPDLKDKLRAGDIVHAFSMRDLANTPMTASATKFQNALKNLNGINKDEIGVTKNIVFSSVDDVRNLIGNVPTDVSVISYNMEGGMTPSSEINDTVNYVRQFAEIVHGTGKKVNFVPVMNHFDSLQQDGRMATIMQSVDMVTYQGQKLYPSVGEDAFVQTMKSKYTYMQNTNPNVKFQLQLWLGQETPEQMISAFNKLRDFMDVTVIGTISDLEGAKQVLYGLMWRLPVTGTPTPTTATTPQPTSASSPTPTSRPTISPTIKPSLSPTAVPASSDFSGLSARLHGDQAVFYFNYAPGARNFQIEISDRSNMTSRGDSNFSKGKDSPIRVDNPRSRWSGYRCGETIYWRVQAENNYGPKSPVQQAQITCR